MCLEGDEYIYVNGESNASIRGTGTEDYFNGGFYYSGGPVSLPFSGCAVIRQSYPLWNAAYRLCIPDPVVFRKGIVAEIEHGGVDDGNGNYYSTALFYHDDGVGSPPADPVHPPLAPGSLVNGGFENGFTSYNGGEASGWVAYQSREYYGQTLCTFSVGTDQVLAGARSQKIVFAIPASWPNASAGIAQQVQVARGSSYRVTAHVRLSISGSLQPGDVVARLGLGTAGNTYYDEPSVVWTEAPSTLNTWHTVSVIATATNDFLSIFVDGLYKPAGVPGPATLWVDEVAIEPYDGPLPPPPPPVIDNPSLETTIPPWTMWVGGSNSDGLERDYVGSGPDGVYALAVKGIGTGGKGACEYIANNWVTNRQYRLSVWVRNLNNSGMRYSIGYALGNLGPAGAAGATYGNAVTGTSTWQLASVDFTYSGVDDGLTVYLKVVNAGASERAGFDKVFIEDTTPSGAPFILQTPASFSHTVTEGQNPSNDTFTVQNAGGGTLSYTISESISWLSVRPAAGTSAGEADPIGISYSAAGLSPGTYNATITISDPDATNTPQTVAITLTIEPAPIPADFDGDRDVDQEDFGHL